MTLSILGIVCSLDYDVSILFHLSNVQCGQLQCMSGQYQFNAGVSVRIGTLRFGNIDGTTTECRYDEYYM